MSAPGLIPDLAIVLVAAGLVTSIFHRLKQPVVLGYIAAGILVGPHLFASGLVRDAGNIETLGGLGVLFLLFSLGLDFHLSRLRKMGVGALVAGSLEIPLMLGAGSMLGRALGWGRIDSLFLGAVVAISSTTIVVKALSDLGRAHEDSARLIYAILVVEDILAVLILAGLSTIATTGSAGARDLIATGLGVSLFLVLTAVIGRAVVPRIIRRVAAPGAGELLVITLMAILFSISLLALHLGYSVALGAFLAGAIVGESREVRAVERLVTPLRDIFGAVFFVSVGLRIDPRLMAGVAGPILAGAAVVIVGKVAACSFGAFVAGYDVRTALRAGMGLGQIGEFSFIIAQLGTALDVVPESLYPIAVGVSAVTTFAAPYLIRSSDRAVELFERLAPAPVVTYVELYGRWVSGLTSTGTRSQVWAVVRKPALQTLLNLLAVSAVLLGTRLVAGGIGREEGGVAGALDAVFWAGAFLLAMPFLIAAWRKIRAISMILAEGALAGRTLPEERALALRNILTHTLSLLAGLLLAAWLLVASSAFLPPLPILIVAAVFLGTLTAALYKWMVRFQASVQATVQRLAATSGDSERTAPRGRILSRYHPYGGAAFDLIIPPGSPAAGRSLRDLEVRSITGATVVAVERGGERVADLPGTPLAPGDVLLLVGEADQIERARALLTGSGVSKA
jgi:K+:H+ antiporter